jgi:hypothetical protein
MNMKWWPFSRLVVAVGQHSSCRREQFSREISTPRSDSCKVEQLLLLWQTAIDESPYVLHHLSPGPEPLVGRNRLPTG